jgi:hypothetical protein
MLNVPLAGAVGAGLMYFSIRTAVPGAATWPATG